MAYPLETGKDAWKYKGVKNLLGGLKASEQPDELPDEACITLKNILAKDGKLRADTGYGAFGQVISGQPQATYEFTKISLLVELLLVTTTTFYKWNASFEKWFLVKGTAGTTTTSSYPAGTTSIVVASATGFATGNLVGIDLDNGDQHQTTITVSGTTFTLADAVPVGRSIPNASPVIKSVALSGSLDKQVSLVTIPANDWVVFTNGVDIVKRYDKTDCIDVPGLPSSGNVVCKALAYYNTALFLLNTVEGGTAYPQRARRSNQADPTDWTGGTAGFDNLLDVSDTILCGEILGPYLIVYRDRSISRGSFIGSSGVNYRFETTITAEGALSSNAVVDMGDYHIFVGHANVYEYRGDFSLQPIGDDIFNVLFGFSGTIDSAYLSRLFALYVEELDELWIAYVSTLSTGHCCDVVLRYNVKKKYWYNREFFDELIGYGLYVKETSVSWNDLVGSWTAQTWTWDSRVFSSSSPTTQLCSGTVNQVFAYDYLTSLDNGNVISYTVETKDFTMPDGAFRFDMLEMKIQGTGILLEYSVDSGVTWTTFATITNATYSRYRVFKQFVADKVRFRWTGSSSDFVLGWFGFSYKHESIF